MKRVKNVLVVTTFLMTLSSQAVEVDCTEPSTEKVDVLSHQVTRTLTYSPAVTSCFSYSDYFKRTTATYSLNPALDTSGLYSNHVVGLSEMKSEFEKQKEICDCINSIDDPSYLMNRYEAKDDNDQVSNSEAYALAHLTKVADTFSARSRYTYDMMILHAQSLDPEMATTYGVDAAMISNDGFREEVNKVVKENVKAGGIVYKENEAALDKKVENIIDNSLKKTPERGIVNVLSDNHLEELEGQSCVPMKDFLLYNSFPENNDFWVSLASTSTFVKEDWDINILKEKFRTSSQRDEGLYASKIEFLEKNPFVKLALNSGDPKVASKVFGVMKKHMTLQTDSCKEKFKGCQNAFKGIVKDYNKEMAKVFKDPHVKKTIHEAREKDLKKLAEDLTSGSKKRIDINTLNDWSRNEFGVDIVSCQNASNPRAPLSNISGSFKSPSMHLSSIGMGEEVKSKMGGIFSETEKFNATYTTRCIQELPKYCKAVGNGVNSLLDKGRHRDWSKISQPKKTLRGLYDGISKSMTPDPQENRSYIDFSREQCENHFRVHNNKSLSFVEYEQMTCKGSTNSLCKNKDLLYQEFLKGSEDIEKNKFFNTDGLSMAAYYKNRPDISLMTKEQRTRFNISGNPFFGKLAKSTATDETSLNEILLAGKESVSSEGSLSQEHTENTISDLIKPNSISHDYTLALNNAQEAKSEIEAEIRSTKESLAYNKERLSRENTTPEFKSEIEQRVKMLENLLAEKEKSAAEYQNIITKILENKENTTIAAASTEAVHKSKDQAKIDESPLETEVRNSVVSNRPVISSQKMNESFEDSSRAPASIAENFSTAGGVKGGAASVGNANSSFASGATGARGKATINSALLSKYGITVQESDSLVQVAQDKERAQVSQLLTNATKSDLGLEVTKTEYEKFKSYDLGALNRLYEEKIEMLDSDVVKLMIHTEGEKESLEFYAIKEDGKVVFQPVRKTKLSDLKNALTH